MKNRYCRRTKLSEEKFMLIFSCFSIGLTATQTHEFSKQEKMPISRQTIERKFIELGEYFYRKFIRHRLLSPKNRRGEGKAATDEYVERAIFKTFWNQLRGKTDYALYRKHGSHYPSNTKLMSYLEDRWKAFNGFPRKTLTSHLGYAFFRLMADSVGEDDASDGFLGALVEDPL